MLDLLIGGDAVRRKMDSALEIEGGKSPSRPRRLLRGRLAGVFGAVPTFGITNSPTRRRARVSKQQPCSEAGGR
jgi:hypothetical protein